MLVNVRLKISILMSLKLETLINAVKDQKTSQGMERMFESEPGKLRTDLMAIVDSKVRALRGELSIDNSRETTRTDQLLMTVQSIQSRIDGLESQVLTTTADDIPLMSSQSDQIHYSLGRSERHSYS